MNRRTTGTIFIVIAAFLYGVYYLSAAIYASNSMGWSRNLFQSMLDYVGNGPKILSLLALITGIGYLVWAEVTELTREKRTEISKFLFGDQGSWKSLNEQYDKEFANGDKKE